VFLYCSYYCRIDESADAVFKFEKFFFDITKPFLEGVKILYDDAFNGSHIVTNQVNRIFYKGSDNIIAGKLLDKGFTIKIEGNSSLGRKEKEIKIPAKTVPVNGTASSLKRDQIQSKYLERLWAFLTIKNLLHESEENKIQLSIHQSNITPKRLPSASSQMSRQKLAENLAKHYNFVTNLTSFIITKDSIEDSNISESPQSMNDLTENYATENVPNFVSKSFRRYSVHEEETNACIGNLELFSQTYLRGKTLSIKKNNSDLGSSDSNKFAALITSIRITGNNGFNTCKMKNLLK